MYIDEVSLLPFSYFVISNVGKNAWPKTNSSRRIIAIFLDTESEQGTLANTLYIAECSVKCILQSA